MSKIVRFDSRPQMATLTQGHEFIVRPRWRLVFPAQDTDDSATVEPSERTGNAGRLAASLKDQVAKLSRRALHPLRRAS